MTRRIVLVTALLLVGMLTWYVGTLLSADAQGLALGLVLGALAGMPPAVLVLAVARRSTSAPAVAEDTWQHEDEDDAPYAAWTPDDRLPVAAWPNPVSLVGENEETFDEYQWGVTRG